MSKPIADAWFHRLKAATRDLTDLCGGVERSGEVANVSDTSVSRWRVATSPDVIPIPAALALEAECGVPLVTTVMAELNGRRLTDGDAAGGSAAGITVRYAEMSRSVGELIAQGAVALADGRFTPAEAELVDRGASEAEQRLAAFRLDLAAAKAGGAGGLKVVG